MAQNEAALESILDEMRKCIKIADFSGLAKLTPRLELAVSAIVPRDAAALQRLKVKAAHNSTLIEAARRGISAARRRLKEARNASEGLQTYDGKGRRADVQLAGTTAARF